MKLSRARALLPLPVLLLLLTISCGTSREADPSVGAVADTVYTNGRIYTVDEAQPWAEALAITDGKLVKVGSNADIEALTGDHTTVLDLKGKFVMPGMVDMHAHPMSDAEKYGVGFALVNKTDPDAMLEELRVYAQANPDSDFIFGGDWNLGVFEGDSPDKKLLDEIVADRPVFLMSQSGHSAWVNSKALELAGFDETFEDTTSIILDRYEGSQEPNGTIRELAQKEVLTKTTFASPERFAPALLEQLDRFTRYGTTALQPAEGSPSWNEGAEILEENHQLNMRLFPAMDWITTMHRDQEDEEVERNISNWRQFSTELIHPQYVKIFADGAPDSRTVLTVDPYEGTEDFYGTMFMNKAVFEEAIPRLYGQGISVHIHCIGDGTAREIVEIFEAAAREYPDSEANLHLAHAWMATPELIERLAAIPNATIDFSPMLAVPAPSLAELFVVPLGQERYQKFFNAKSAVETGMPVGFGSDFSSSLVDEPNNFWYMEGWVTRQFPENPDFGTLNGDEALSVEQAIHGFTLGGARALGYDYADEFGSIEEGKSADFVVLDRNLLEIEPSTIHQTEVLQTVFRGKAVYSAE